MLCLISKKAKGSLKYSSLEEASSNSDALQNSEELINSEDFSYSDESKSEESSNSDEASKDVYRAGVGPKNGKEIVKTHIMQEILSINERLSICTSQNHTNPRVVVRN